MLLSGLLFKLGGGNSGLDPSGVSEVLTLSCCCSLGGG